MIYLSLEEVLILHEYQIEKFGGAQGILDIRLLESAILRPQTTFGGKDLYDDLYLKSAVLALSIIKNHPFVEGNKRTGLHAALVFLELNGVSTNVDNEELITLSLNIATNVLDSEGFAETLGKNSNGK